MVTNAQIIPDRSSISPQAGADNVFQLKPTVPITNAAFDCTPITGVVLKYTVPSVYSGEPPQNGSVTPTFLNAGPSGIQIVISEQTLGYLWGGTKSLNPAAYIMGTEASANTYLLWAGTVNIQANLAQLNQILQ